MVAIGGADRTLTIWDATTANIIYKVRFRFVPGIGKNDTNAQLFVLVTGSYWNGDFD
jgi:hypothetical protein